MVVLSKIMWLKAREPFYYRIPILRKICSGEIIGHSFLDAIGKVQDIQRCQKIQRLDPPINFEELDTFEKLCNAHAGLIAQINPIYYPFLNQPSMP